MINEKFKVGENVFFQILQSRKEERCQITLNENGSNKKILIICDHNKFYAI